MKIRGWGKEYDVVPVVAKYFVGNTLAVQLKCWNEEYSMWEPYGNLTVKLGDDKETDTRAYVDVNNMPEAEKFIEENGLGEFTGEYGFSGYCVYPLYEFYVKKMEG